MAASTLTQLSGRSPAPARRRRGHVLGPRRHLPLPRDGRGDRRRLLRDGGRRAAGRRTASAHPPQRGRDVLRPRGLVCHPARRRVDDRGRRRLRQRAARHRALLPQRGERADAHDPHLHARRHREVLRGDAGARARPRRAVPDNVDEVAARYADAAPRYGLEFLGGEVAPHERALPTTSWASRGGPAAGRGRGRRGRRGSPRRRPARHGLRRRPAAWTSSPTSTWSSCAGTRTSPRVPRASSGRSRPGSGRSWPASPASTSASRGC